MKHPIQNIALDKSGSPRFVENPIVRYILEKGKPHGIDLNDISAQGFDAEDKQQFAQLIGYSLSGYSELSYVTDAAYGAAKAKFETGQTDEQALIAILEKKLKNLRVMLRMPMAELFEVHPDDLRK